LTVVLVGTAFAVLRVRFEGPLLGDNIASLLNKRMRGRIEVGSVEWPTSALKTVVTGGWIPVTIRDVRLWDDCALSAQATESEQLRTGDPNEDCTPDDRPDPDPTSKRKPRKLLIRTELVTAELDAHAAIFGNHDLVFRNVWVHGGEALIEQTREPYPLHAYDQTIVSIVTAFYPRQKAGFRAGIYADSPPPTFDLRDVHLAGLNLTLHMSPYSLAKPEQIGYAVTARLEGVEVDAGPDPANNSYLYVDPTDPLIKKFYVRLAVTGKRGTLRILDEGPRDSFRLPLPGPLGAALATGAARTARGLEEVPPGRSAMYTLTLADIKLDRLAQLPNEWARHDFVANTLELDLRARALPCTPLAADGHDAAELHLSGELFNYADRPFDGAWNLKLDARNLGPTVRTCIKPMVGGDHLDGMITLTGPFVAAPAVGLDLTGVDVDVPLNKTEEPLRLTIAELHGKIDLVNEEGYIEKTKALVKSEVGAPGEVELSATFGLKPLYTNALVEIVKAVDMKRFLPAQLGPIGRYLQGRLRAIGDVEEGFELSDFDLALGATPREKAVRLHHGRLFTKDSFDSIEIERVYLEAGRSHAMFDGRVDIARNDMNVRIDGDFPDLDVWLKRFGIPAFLKSAGGGGGGAGGGTITLTGPVTKPTVTVTDTLLAGIPCIDKLHVGRLAYHGNTVDIAKVSSPGLGGTLDGTGRVIVGGRVPVIERLALTGSKLDASRLCGLKGLVKGTIDEVAVDLHGDVNLNRSGLELLGLGKIYARADRLSVLDDKYSAITACVNRDDPRCPRPALVDAADAEACKDGKRAAALNGGGFCLAAAATRDAGGKLDALIAQLPAARVGNRVAPAHLGGVLAISDLPLALIDQLRGKPKANAIGGLASITMHLQGSPAAPQATGAINLLRTWLGTGLLGDAQIDVVPTVVKGVPGLKLDGQALAGRLHITGAIGTAAPFPVELSLSGTRFELDAFLNLRALLKLDDPVQAWATGTVTVTTELAPAGTARPEAWIELSELAVQLDHRASDGRVTPLSIRVKDQVQRVALSIHATPTSLEFACRDPKAPGKRTACSTILQTPAGDIVIDGHASEQEVAVHALGDLDLGQLSTLFDQQLRAISGRVRLDASVAGGLRAPTYEVSIDLDPEQIYQKNQAERDARAEASRKHLRRVTQPMLEGEAPVTFTPAGTDTTVTVPHGLIKLAHGSIGFTDVQIQVRDDQRVQDAGDLHVAGNIQVDGVTPTYWTVVLRGKIPGKALQVIAPAAVSQANGLIAIEDQLLLSGPGLRPSLSGTLAFDHFSLALRGLHRELAFNTGTVDLTTEATGEHATYALELAGINGALDEGQLSNIAGTLEIRDGQIARARVRLDATSLPFRVPQVLDLVVSATGIEIVRDDPASSWRVGGTITVIDGAYLRNFELADQISAIGVNSAPSRPIWDEYPSLGSAELDLHVIVQRFAFRSNIATVEFRSDAIQVTNTPRDPRLAGQIRVTQGEFRVTGVRARFTRTSGTVDFAENQLASNPALNVVSEADYHDLSGQDHVITARFAGTLSQPTWDLTTSTGYNKSQTLSLLLLGRNQEQLRRSLGDQALGGDPTRADPTTNPSNSVADQIVKDLAGDWVSSVLGDSLTKVTGLDALRIEIGFGSIGLHLEWKIIDAARVLVDAEQAIRGTTIRGRAELKTPYVISVQLGYLNQNYYDPAEQDIEDVNLKLVYPFFIP
jgi:hypothetical protein